MKQLYHVKKGSEVVITDVDIVVPPSSVPVNQGDRVRVINFDGLYCNCTNKDGEYIKIASWTMVQEI